MRLWKHGKKSSIASIKHFSKIIRQRKQMKENSWLKEIFLIHAHISCQPSKTHIWQHITNQNWCDVRAVFLYSHLNTAIDQWECAYYPNYFIKINIASPDKVWGNPTQKYYLELSLRWHSCTSIWYSHCTRWNWSRWGVPITRWWHYCRLWRIKREFRWVW